ncbi:MAG: hypothetical protein WC858_06150 [Parcubacteria group bacterium]|jgi:hypothetical protein
MPKNQSKTIDLKDIKNLLSDQTLTILSAVDERLEKSEDRINQKIEKLINTLDKFLKRVSNLEEEFELMKHDLNKVKMVIRKKLGIELI